MLRFRTVRQNPSHFIRHAMPVAFLVNFFKAGQGNPLMLAHQVSQTENRFPGQGQILAGVFLEEGLVIGPGVQLAPAMSGYPQFR
jgi:hypothetical protein